MATIKCADCFFRWYSEYREGKYAELQTVTWRCNVKGGRPLILKVVALKGEVVEKKLFPDVYENCSDYRKVGWELEHFKTEVIV